MNNPDVDTAMIVCFRQKSVLPDIRLDGTMLLIQANKFIEQFKQRYGIVCMSKGGESAGVDQEIMHVWKDGKLQELLRKYEPLDIYNVDET